MLNTLRKVVRLLLCCLVLFDQSALAQGASQNSSGSNGLVLRYDANAKLFHWLRVGGRPVVPGGVPTRERFAAFVRGQEFARAVIALGIGDRIEEAKTRVADGEFFEEQLEPNTSASIFLKMAFAEARVLGPVIWSGEGPLDVWVLKLNGLRLDIPKGCANVGMTTSFKTEVRTITIEKEVPGPVREIEVPGPVQEVKVPINVNPCGQSDWNGWTTGRLGAYAFEHSKAKKLRVSELLAGEWDNHSKLDEGRFEFWTVLASQRIKGRDLKAMVAEYVRARMPELNGKKVQLLIVTYDRCRDTLQLDWYVEGWHWREFVIGFVAGFALGYWVRGGPPVKGNFFNPADRPRTIITSVINP